MPYIKEIEECLKIIRSLENSFQTAKTEEMFTLSFFSINHDQINELKERLNHLEALRIKEKKKEEELEWEMTHQKPVLPDACILPEQSTTIKEISVNVVFEEKDILKEKNSSVFLGDKIGKKIFLDIRSSLSLNDRFRFQRDLFRGNNEIMDEALTQLNYFDSIKDALFYLDEQFSWDWEDPSVKAFKEVLKKRFY
ncbi:hypothetical protein LJB92_03030 [Bacteroidales bacterium OttesenSCG-928-M06]|nr:hypothetical protein [Bacteroidales bacterium OttesenSCG-928-M06]